MAYQKDSPKDSWSRESTRAVRSVGPTAAAMAVKLESLLWAPTSVERMACDWVGSSAETKAGQTDAQLVGYSAVSRAGNLAAQKAACWVV